MSAMIVGMVAYLVIFLICDRFTKLILGHVPFKACWLGWIQRKVVTLLFTLVVLTVLLFGYVALENTP